MKTSRFALDRAVTLLMAVGVSLALLSPAAASASTPPPPAAAAISGSYCFTEVAPIAPGSRELGVVSRTCSDTPAAPGSKLPAGMAQTSESTATPTGENSAAASMDLLVTLFEHDFFRGRYDTLGGRFGTCDTAGYGFSDLRLANFNTGGITSYIPNGACKYTSYWNGLNYTGAARINFNGSNRFVGATWNDNMYSMKIRA